MTAGSVVENGLLVSVTPASTGPNVATVSYQTVKGAQMIDVNLNGSNNYYPIGQVAFVYYLGSGTSGTQTFQNTTTLHTVAWGGTGTNLFEGGPGPDEFIGGSGTNTFDAGTGDDILEGGLGTNIYNENAAGSGEILERGTSNTINTSGGSAANYQVL
jgi:Ca2+-binding RTX toxin-like protein